MTGICGWFGAVASSADGELVKSMGEVLKTHPAERLSIERGDGLALAVARQQSGDLIAFGDLQIAYLGQPRWADRQLQELALAQGFGAAAAEAYRAYGDALFSQLRGHYLVALLDRARQCAGVAVDRLGTLPLAYITDPAIPGLIFSSSLTALRQFPGIGAEIDPQAIFDYLYFHKVPAPRAFYRGMRKLQPAELLWFENNQLQRRRHWQISYHPSGRRDLPKLESALRGTLERAVGRSCQQEESVGAFLSGGTDSSTIAGLLRQLQGRPAKSFSIGFDAEGFDEMEYADIAVRHFDLEPHRYYVTPEDVADLIPRVAAVYDEPFGNASAIPAFYCAKLAADAGVTTLLGGDGGDELFAGNARYAKQLLFEAYFKLPGGLRAALEPLLLGSGMGGAPLLAKGRRYIEQALVPLPDRLESYNLLHRFPLAEMLTPELLAAIDPEGPIQHLREVYQASQAPDPLRRMLELDHSITLADDDLRKVRRMVELAGIEVQFPLLDDEVVELSAQIAPQLLIRRLKLRWFYKHALRGFLPNEIINKQKHGFGLPFGLWLREHPPLQELAIESLKNLSGRGYIRPDYSERLLAQHAGEHASYFGVMVWVLMMLEQWLQQHGH